LATQEGLASAPVLSSPPTADEIERYNAFIAATPQDASAAPQGLVVELRDGRYLIVAGQHLWPLLAGRERLNCYVQTSPVAMDRIERTGVLTNPCLASAELCAMLLLEQGRRTTTNLSPPVFPVSDGPVGPRRNRAKWLKDEMQRRGFETVNSLEAASNVDKKTIKKILGGFPVDREDVLERLARGLSSAGEPRLSLRDIPEN
jgi:hypothetical protein